MRWWRRIVGACMVLAAVPALAQDAVSLRPMLERYARAKTYCESGRVSESPGHPPYQFTFCAGDGGRFKLVTGSGSGQTVTWAHGDQVRTYSPASGELKDYPRDPQYTYGFRFGGGRPPAAYSHLLWTWGVRRLDTLDRLDSIDGFAPQPALSTPGTTVLERRRAGGATRLHVRNADQVITRYEADHDGRTLQYVHLDSVQLDGPLADSDLSHAAPLLAHVSFRHSPLAFLLFVLGGSAAAGALGWSWFVVRAADARNALRLRSRLWRVQAVAFVAIAAVLGVLAVLTIIGEDSGHPPAIVMVLVLTAVCGLVFAALACATLASYPVHWLLRRPAPEVPEGLNRP